MTKPDSLAEQVAEWRTNRGRVECASTAALLPGLLGVQVAFWKESERQHLELCNATRDALVAGGHGELAKRLGRERASRQRVRSLLDVHDIDNPRALIEALRALDIHIGLVNTYVHYHNTKAGAR